MQDLGYNHFDPEAFSVWDLRYGVFFRRQLRQERDSICFIWFVYPDSIKIRGSNLFLCVFVLTTTHDTFVVQKVSKIWDERISRAGL